MRSDRVMRRPTPSLKEYALAYPRAGDRRSTARSSASVEARVLDAPPAGHIGTLIVRAEAA
ncbi:hypothetical protein AB0D34_23570 [Streptomyces sp. NPDC048420]|uniref:hypothetical protein n=1 Tax=Streptomyces sp. NPDC048420 TaxID=3155755 RepID=UPI00343A7EEB